MGKFRILPCVLKTRQLYSSKRARVRVTSGRSPQRPWASSERMDGRLHASALNSVLTDLDQEGVRILPTSHPSGSKDTLSVKYHPRLLVTLPHSSEQVFSLQMTGSGPPASEGW